MSVKVSDVKIINDEDLNLIKMVEDISFSKGVDLLNTLVALNTSKQTQLQLASS